MPQRRSPLAYRSYLLRLWADGPDGGSETSWRFSLEDPRTGARAGFDSLDRLFGFVAGLTSETQVFPADSEDTCSTPDYPTDS